MKFVIAIESGDDNHAFGVVVPDLTGCFSAGDTLDEALENAKEAILLWCETVYEDGGIIPLSNDVVHHQTNPEFAGWEWSVVDVAVERYLGATNNINATLPKSQAM